MAGAQPYPKVRLRACHPFIESLLMRSALIALMLMICSAPAAIAQTLQPILQTHAAELAKPSRRSVREAPNAIPRSGVPHTTALLEHSP